MDDCTQVKFWAERYQAEDTPWDKGRAAPAFGHWLDAADAPPVGRAIALGCGRGHDALLFAERGFTVTGVDFAAEAIAAARAQAQARGLAATFQQHDIFDLPADWQGQFDYVIEHTCFCAIDPAGRDRYVQVARDLLRPGGALLGIFFTHNRPDGPPFGATAAEVRQRFAGAFSLETLAPIPPEIALRPGEEYWGCFRRGDN